jgi:hypothetical protein
MKAAKILPDSKEKARELEGQADGLQVDAEALREAARLEDLHIWQMEKVKTIKEGHPALWLLDGLIERGDRVRNVHLGSCARLDEETALQKAREIKAEALRLRGVSDGEILLLQMPTPC